MSAVVVIPTYNERDNIENLINEILSLDSEVDVLVVDDHSPDATGELVKNISQHCPKVHLIDRTQERGRGLAGIAGFKYAIQKGYDYILEMDADFSHQPKHLPQFLEAIQHHDVVVGSRLIKGGRIVGRNLFRNILTALANWYVRLILGFAIKDWTSGFRCYKKSVLASLDFENMNSKGPSLLEEMLFICYRRSYDIYEIPITFMERKKGTSKLTLRELCGVFITVLKIRLKA